MNNDKNSVFVHTSEALSPMTLTTGASQSVMMLTVSTHVINSFVIDYMLASSAVHTIMQSTYDPFISRTRSATSSSGARKSPVNSVVSVISRMSHSHNLIQSTPAPVIIAPSATTKNSSSASQLVQNPMFSSSRMVSEYSSVGNSESRGSTTSKNGKESASTKTLRSVHTPTPSPPNEWSSVFSMSQKYLTLNPMVTLSTSNYLAREAIVTTGPDYFVKSKTTTSLQFSLQSSLPPDVHVTMPLHANLLPTLTITNPPITNPTVPVSTTNLFNGETDIEDKSESNQSRKETESSINSEESENGSIQSDIMTEKSTTKESTAIHNGNSPITSTSPAAGAIIVDEMDYSTTKVLKSDSGTAAFYLTSSPGPSQPTSLLPLILPTSVSRLILKPTAYVATTNPYHKDEEGVNTEMSSSNLNDASAAASSSSNMSIRFMSTKGAVFPTTTLKESSTLVRNENGEFHGNTGTYFLSTPPMFSYVYTTSQSATFVSMKLALKPTVSTRIAPVSSTVSDVSYQVYTTVQTVYPSSDPGIERTKPISFPITSSKTDETIAMTHASYIVPAKQSPTPINGKMIRLSTSISTVLPTGNSPIASTSLVVGPIIVDEVDYSTTKSDSETASFYLTTSPGPSQPTSLLSLILPTSVSRLILKPTAYVATTNPYHKDEEDVSTKMSSSDLNDASAAASSSSNMSIRFMSTKGAVFPTTTLKESSTLVRNENGEFHGNTGTYYLSTPPMFSYVYTTSQSATFVSMKLALKPTVSTRIAPVSSTVSDVSYQVYTTVQTLYPSSDPRIERTKPISFPITSSKTDETIAMTHASYIVPAKQSPTPINGKMIRLSTSISTVLPTGNSPIASTSLVVGPIIVDEVDYSTTKSDSETASFYLTTSPGPSQPTSLLSLILPTSVSRLILKPTAYVATTNPYHKDEEDVSKKMSSSDLNNASAAASSSSNMSIRFMSTKGAVFPTTTLKESSTLVGSEKGEFPGTYFLSTPSMFSYVYTTSQSATFVSMKLALKPTVSTRIAPVSSTVSDVSFQVYTTVQTLYPSSDPRIERTKPISFPITSSKTDEAIAMTHASYIVPAKQSPTPINGKMIRLSTSISTVISTGNSPIASTSLVVGPIIVDEVDYSTTKSDSETASFYLTSSPGPSQPTSLLSLILPTSVSRLILKPTAYVATTNPYHKDEEDVSTKMSSSDLNNASAAASSSSNMSIRFMSTKGAVFPTTTLKESSTLVGSEKGEFPGTYFLSTPSMFSYVYTTSQSATFVSMKLALKPTVSTRIAPVSSTVSDVSYQVYTTVQTLYPSSDPGIERTKLFSFPFTTEEAIPMTLASHSFPTKQSSTPMNNKMIHLSTSISTVITTVNSPISSTSPVVGPIIVDEVDYLTTRILKNNAKTVAFYLTSSPGPSQPTSLLPLILPSSVSRFVLKPTAYVATTNPYHKDKEGVNTEMSSSDLNDASAVASSSSKMSIRFMSTKGAVFPTTTLKESSTFVGSENGEFPGTYVLSTPSTFPYTTSHPATFLSMNLATNVYQLALKPTVSGRIAPVSSTVSDVSYQVYTTVQTLYPSSDPRIERTKPISFPITSSKTKEAIPMTLASHIVPAKQSPTPMNSKMIHLSTSISTVITTGNSPIASTLLVVGPIIVDEVDYSTTKVLKNNAITVAFYLTSSPGPSQPTSLLPLILPTSVSQFALKPTVYVSTTNPYHKDKEGVHVNTKMSSSDLNNASAAASSSSNMSIRFMSTKGAVFPTTTLKESSKLVRNENGEFHGNTGTYYLSTPPMFSYVYTTSQSATFVSMKLALKPTVSTRIAPVSSTVSDVSYQVYTTVQTVYPSSDPGIERTKPFSFPFTTEEAIPMTLVSHSFPTKQSSTLNDASAAASSSSNMSIRFMSTKGAVFPTTTLKESSTLVRSENEEFPGTYFLSTPSTLPYVYTGRIMPVSSTVSDVSFQVYATVQTLYPSSDPRTSGIGRTKPVSFPFTSSKTEEPIALTLASHIVTAKQSPTPMDSKIIHLSTSVLKNGNNPIASTSLVFGPIVTDEMDYSTAKILNSKTAFYLSSSPGRSYPTELLPLILPTSVSQFIWKPTAYVATTNLYHKDEEGVSTEMSSSNLNDASAVASSSSNMSIRFMSTKGAVFPTTTLKESSTSMESGNGEYPGAYFLSTPSILVYVYTTSKPATYLSMNLATSVYQLALKSTVSTRIAPVSSTVSDVSFQVYSTVQTLYPSSDPRTAGIGTTKPISFPITSSKTEETIAMTHASYITPSPTPVKNEILHPTGSVTYEMDYEPSLSMHLAVKNTKIPHSSILPWFCEAVQMEDLCLPRAEVGETTLGNCSSQSSSGT